MSLPARQSRVTAFPKDETAPLVDRTVENDAELADAILALFTADVDYLLVSRLDANLDWE